MTLTLSNTAQQAAYQKVRDYLTASELFKDTLRALEGQPKFQMFYGSTLVEVEVQEWEYHPWEPKDLAIVRASSCVTISSTLDPELLRFLLQENRRMRFGAFHVDEAGLVIFSHSVLGGENMDLMELQSCILSVVTVADTYDDLIISKFGGHRARDIAPSES